MRETKARTSRNKLYQDSVTDLLKEILLAVGDDDTIVPESYERFLKWRDKENAGKESGDAPDDARLLFDYWGAVMHRGRCSFDQKRRIAIQKGLEFAKAFDDPIGACKDAIIGITRSDFHMGKNERGRRYTSLSVIFKNAENFEGFQAKGERIRAAMERVRG